MTQHQCEWLGCTLGYRGQRCAVEERERREYEGGGLGNLNLEVGTGLQQREMQRTSQEERAQARSKPQWSSGRVRVMIGS